MIKVVPISKRGTITLPPPFRKKMRLDQVDNPLMLVEERDGKLIMELASAVPVRDIPGDTLKAWIDEDEVDGAAVRKSRKKGK
jgi:bifunctional DNA-binding transcriptional regulator/antitoxin component of YhaV-PrlF toxin-antitoxin module